MTKDKSLEILGYYFASMSDKLSPKAEDSPEVKEEKEFRRRWIKRKCMEHPMKCFYFAEKFLQCDEVRYYLYRGPYEERDINNVVLVTSLLHDIGRVLEVNYTDGTLIPKFKHDFEGARYLKRELGITDYRILIPTRYHGVLDYEKALDSDLDYFGLEGYERSLITSLGHFLRDIDKLANIWEVAKYGLKDRLEMTSPQYKNIALVSPKVKEAILQGRNPDKADEVSRVDALLRFASWSLTLNFEVSRQEVKEHLLGIREHTYTTMLVGSMDAQVQAKKDVDEVFDFLFSKNEI